MLNLLLNRKYLALLFAIALSKSGISQVKDFRTWTQLSIEKKFNRNWSIETLGGIRMGQNSTHMEVSYIESGLNYLISKNWQTELHYRYSNKTEYTDKFQSRHRLHFKVTYSKKVFNRIKTSTSLMFQKQYTNIYTSDDGMYPANYFRGQLKLAYDTNKQYEPYLSTELFYQLKYNKKEFNRVRYELGFKYEINKYNQFKLFYMIQREFNEPNPIHSFIIGGAYKLKI